MKEFLHGLAHYIALWVELIAILIIAFGSLPAVVNSIRFLVLRKATNMPMRAVWLLGVSMTDE